MNVSYQTKRLSKVVAIAATLVLCVGACSSSRSTSTPSSSPRAASEIEIKLIAFHPATMHIAAGVMVTWHQNDPGVHTVTSGTVETIVGGVNPKPDGGFASGSLPTGKSFSKRFTKPGRYPFFCEIHPATMRGEIIVG